MLLRDVKRKTRDCGVESILLVYVFTYEERDLLRCS